MPHAIHERCIAPGINRLWLSMFVLQETVCCSLYNAWYSHYMSFQISSTVSFINLKVCLSLQWDYMRLCFLPQGIGISSTCICSLLCCPTWMEAPPKHVEMLWVVFLPMFLYLGSDLRQTVSKATTFDHLRGDGGGRGPEEVMRHLWNTHEENYTRENSCMHARYSGDANEWMAKMWSSNLLHGVRVELVYPRWFKTG